MSDTMKQHSAAPMDAGTRLYPCATDGGRRRPIRRLLLELLEQRVPLTGITSVDPSPSSHHAPVATNVAATFDHNINGATATQQTFVVHGDRSGQLVAASINTEGQTVTLDPSNNFFPGERVQVSATAGILSTAGDPNVPRSWEFLTATSTGSGQFVQTGQVLSAHSTRGMDMGDLDGDGDLDVLQANSITLGGGDTNRVWLNDGNGNFTDSGQLLGTHSTEAVALGDLDGDGDLDFISANLVVQSNRVWLNDGGGRFTDSGQPIGSSSSVDVELGDVDGDGDLDVYVVNYFSPDRLYLNDGGGRFTDSGQNLGSSNGSDRVSLGDLDGDGDLDSFIANGRLPAQPNRVWLNDGSGVFSNSGQLLGANLDRDLRLGDVDNDGDLDAVGSSRLWLNDGSAMFADSGQSIGAPYNEVAVGDLDGDGDLDIFYKSDEVQVLLNNGSGVFTPGGQSLPTGGRRGGMELGDLDSDGDLDAYVTHRNESDVVWINQNLTPSVTLSVDNSTIPEDAGTATITATLSAAHTGPVTVELGIFGTATVTDDYTISDRQIVLPIGATTRTATLTAVDDRIDESNETVIVEITSLTNAREVGMQQVTTTILDDDEPPAPDVTLTVDNVEIPEAGGVAIFVATLSEPTTVPVTVDLEITGTATAGDYAASAAQLVIGRDTTSATMTVTAIQDNENEPNETVVVAISGVVNGNVGDDHERTTTIVDDDVSPSFTVRSMSAGASGVRIELTAALDTTEINLYDSTTAEMGAADVIVTGAKTGPAAGSLVIGSSNGGPAIEAKKDVVTFIASGGLLAADTYTITLVSGETAFKNADGALLDGNGDGTGGDDFVGEFTIGEHPADAREVSIPDFVRGPGQEVNLPAGATAGIPVMISDGEGVLAVDMRIAYDPALLQITQATAPAGGSVTINTLTPGLAILVFFSIDSLPPGPTQFIRLGASVPSENAGAILGRSQILDVHAVVVGDGEDNEFPTVADDAVHLVSYFGDVSGNLRINAADAAQVARAAALIDNGFASSLVTDPMLIGDISGNGRINAADASLVARSAALIDVPEIPHIPVGVVAGSRSALDSSYGALHVARERTPIPVAEAPPVAPFGSSATAIPISEADVDRLIANQGRSTALFSNEEVSLSLELAIEELLAAGVSLLARI